MEQSKEMTNGVDVGQVMDLISAIESDSEYAKFQFRATNQWVDGGQTRSRIKDFYAGNAEDTTRKQAFVLDSDEPVIAAGQDSAPNAMEYVLHALAACMTASLIYHAAVRGIDIEAVDRNRYHHQVLDQAIFKFDRFPALFLGLFFADHYSLLPALPAIICPSISGIIVQIHSRSSTGT